MQIVVLLLAVLGLYAAAAAGVVLLLFILAAVIALILNPVVGGAARAAPRGLAIAVVYAGFFITLPHAGTSAVANPIADQVSASARRPSIVDDANAALADLQACFDDQGIDIEIKAQGETALGTLQDRVVEGRGGRRVPARPAARVIEARFSVILVFVLSIYMLIYGERIGRWRGRSCRPATARRRTTSRARAARGAGYVRGQLLFSPVMGASAGIALCVYGVLGIFPQGRRTRSPSACSSGSWS